MSNNTNEDVNYACPSLTGIRDAQRILSTHIDKTPLIRSEELSQLFKADVWIKNETASPISCFKLRGALTELIRQKNLGNITAAVTSSTGNHGQAVAYAARLLGIPAYIFLPGGSNKIKLSKIKMLGATSYDFFGKDIDEAKVEAKQFSDSKGYSFIDDGESLGVMEGAGTVGLEIVESLEAIDTVFIPMGSGSLASGSAAAIKALQPDAKVIAVQAKGSPAMVESFRLRRSIEYPVKTIADGLVCRKPAKLSLDGILRFVNEADLVDDEDLLKGIHTLAVLAHILVEPSGAAAIASAWRRRKELAGQRIVFVLTGANITTETLRESLSYAPYS